MCLQKLFASGVSTHTHVLTFTLTLSRLYYQPHNTGSENISLGCSRQNSIQVGALALWGQRLLHGAAAPVRWTKWRTGGSRVPTSKLQSLGPLDMASPLPHSAVANFDAPERRALDDSDFEFLRRWNALAPASQDGELTQADLAAHVYAVPFFVARLS